MLLSDLLKLIQLEPFYFLCTISLLTAPEFLVSVGDYKLTKLSGIVGGSSYLFTLFDMFKSWKQWTLFLTDLV